MREMKEKMCGMWDYPSTKHVGGVSNKFKLKSEILTLKMGKIVKDDAGSGRQRSGKNGTGRRYAGQK